MKLSMWMLNDALGENVRFRGLDERAERLTISGLLPYRSPDRLGPDHVYLIAAERLAEVRRCADACFLVCGATNMPEIDGLFLCLDASLGSDVVLWLALSAFEHYNHWYEELQNELAEKPELTRICETAYSLLGNPITLFDPNHALIARAGIRDLTDILEEKPGFQLVLSDEAYKALMTHPGHRDDIQPRTAVITASPFGEGRLLFIDILCEQQEYRLCVIELDRPFLPGDPQLLLILSDVLHTALLAEHSRDDLAKKDLTILLESLLNGDLRELPEQEPLLRPWGWAARDRYLCLCVEKKRADGAFVPNDQYVCSRVEELLGDACAFMTEGRIACVLHLAEGEEAAEAVSRLERFIRDNIFLVGVSEPFEGLTGAAAYYRAARVAIRAARREENGPSIRRFGDAAVTELLREGLSGLPPFAYCLPELDRLRRLSDARVDYAETLRVYIENERNLLLSAEKLHIHRTTLFYRLGRIREELGLDLEDPDVRFRILLSFRLMELGN